MEGLEWLLDKAISMVKSLLGGGDKKSGGAVEPVVIAVKFEGETAGHELKNDGEDGALVVHTNPTPLADVASLTAELAAANARFFTALKQRRALAKEVGEGPPTAEQATQLAALAKEEKDAADQVGAIGAKIPIVPAGDAKGEEVWGELSAELGLKEVSVKAKLKAERIADAVKAADQPTTDAAGNVNFLVGSDGTPGAAMVGVQPHGDATDTRNAMGVKGSTHQSAHVGASGFLKDLANYSREQALTIIMDVATHKAFDNHWKAWVHQQPGKDVTVKEMFDAMVRAIDQIPNVHALSEATPGDPTDLLKQWKGTIAHLLHIEIYGTLGLTPTQRVRLPMK
jgi:hypothetical protein